MSKLRLMLRLIVAFAHLVSCVISAAASTGCGYSLQNSHSELLDKEGIRTVYVNPLSNSTYKPGIENVVYNALIRTLLSHRRVKLVSSEADADAILYGTVTQAFYSISGSADATQLSPKLPATLPSGLTILGTSVATVYMATMACNFTLVRRVVPPGKKRDLWSAGFSRPQPFSASNQLDVPGATSALINESEFDRALSTIATAMMDDVHESMLAMF